MKKAEKKFLKVPEYPGGKEALRKYIMDNLVYPEEALTQRIEGIVHLIADINDNGFIENVKIEKGIGYGCDEEAVRLVKSIHFGSVKNKGIRLHTQKRFRINFKLPSQQKIKYNFVKTEDNTNPKTKLQSYSYSIKLDKNQY
jgi:TonB family protein